jgi:hypothetical protein
MFPRARSIRLQNILTRTYDKKCRKCSKDFKAKVSNAKYYFECRDTATKART